jgi:molybdopterin-binding protein
MQGAIADIIGPNPGGRPPARSIQFREAGMKLSARNMLKGKVKKIVSGAVNSEVVIETAAGELLVSIITKESVESLGLKEGKGVYAVIKASNVMVAVD